MFRQMNGTRFLVAPVHGKLLIFIDPTQPCVTVFANHPDADTAFSPANIGTERREMPVSIADNDVEIFPGAGRQRFKADGAFGLGFFHHVFGNGNAVRQVVHIDRHRRRLVAGNKRYHGNTKAVGVVNIALNRNIAHAVGADHQAWFIGGTAAMECRAMLSRGKRAAPTGTGGSVIIGGIGSGQIPFPRRTEVLVIAADLRTVIRAIGLYSSRHSPTVSFIQVSFHDMRWVVVLLLFCMS